MTINKKKRLAPLPLFDTLEYIKKQKHSSYLLCAQKKPADTIPLLLKTKGNGSIGITTYIREIIQSCFDRAITKLNEDGHIERKLNCHGGFYPTEIVMLAVHYY